MQCMDLVPEARKVFIRRMTLLAAALVKGPLGRRGLGMVANLSERIARSEAEALTRMGWLASKNRGLVITELGREGFWACLDDATMWPEPPRSTDVVSPLELMGDASSRLLCAMAVRQIAPLVVWQPVVAVSGGPLMATMLRYWPAQPMPVLFVPLPGEDPALPAVRVARDLARLTGGQYLANADVLLAQATMAICDVTTPGNKHRRQALEGIGQRLYLGMGEGTALSNYPPATRLFCDSPLAITLQNENQGASR